MEYVQNVGGEDFTVKGDYFGCQILCEDGTIVAFFGVGYSSEGRFQEYQVWVRSSWVHLYVLLVDALCQGYARATGKYADQVRNYKAVQKALRRINNG